MSSCLPELLEELSESCGANVSSLRSGKTTAAGLTDIVCVELVDTDEDTTGSGSENPLHDGSEDGPVARVKVVDPDLVEALRE